MSNTTSRIPKVVLLIESSRSSGRSLLRGVAEYARHHGPWAFYWEPGGLEKAGPRLRSLDADGIILRDIERLDEVLGHNIPAIVVGHSKRQVRGLSNVITDSTMIAKAAAEHLIDCGFRSFAFIGFNGLPWSDTRKEAFEEVTREAGYEVHEYPAEARHTEATLKAERNSMAAWLKKLPHPVGIMACNDDRAQQVVEACKLAQLRVPDEVGIIGADNDELVCELSDPPLSSVAINFERAGFESARLLHEMMRATRVSKMDNIIVQPSHVVARQSTDIMFIDDPAVARAVRFIRHNSKQQLNVDDVVRAAGLSRRVLEKRFRGLVGRSVLSEIRRVRVDQIARMLTETNYSVSEIAFSMGFAGVEHFARYFRQEKQTTPLAYRKKHGRR